MHNTGKINFKIHGKYFIFCIAESMVMQGHGDEVSAQKAVLKLNQCQRKSKALLPLIHLTAMTT